MSDIVLGIDLGTTNSVVSVADGTQVRVLSDEGGHRLVPSVVSFHPEKRVLVGDEARSRRLIDAKNTIYSVKRLIGRPFKSPEVQRAQQRFAFELRESPNGGVLVVARGETYTLTEISAFVLREVRRVAEQALGQVVTRAVITVPAAFNELQRSATKAAGRVAGLDVLRIVNEPTAAALAYGLGRDKPERIAVYDLGGGTFDLTLLELDKDVFEVLGTAGDSFLGGDDIDVVIAEMMADDFLKAHRWDPRQDEQAFERLRAAGEWAKCKLSSAERAELTIEELTYGPNGAALNLEWTCTREALEERIMPIAARSFEVCKEALRDAGMAAGDVDSVILVGGSTRIPLVRRMVESFFGKAPRTDIDPDLVVAQGAAIHGFTVSGAQKKPQGALGRVALRKATLAEVKAVQEQRAATRAEGPKQPAFAPTNQIDLPAAPKPAYHPPSPASMGRGPKQTVVGVGASAPIVPPVVAPMAESLDLAPTPKPSGKKLSLGKKAQPSAPSPFDLDAAFGAPKPSGAPLEPSGLLTLDEPGALEPSFAAPLPRSDAPKKRPATLMGVGAGIGIDSPWDMPDVKAAPPSRAERPSEPVLELGDDELIEEDEPIEELDAGMLESFLPPARASVIAQPVHAVGVAATHQPMQPIVPATMQSVGTQESEPFDGRVLDDTSWDDAALPDMPDLLPDMPELEYASPGVMAQPVLSMEARSAPILMDVTPLSLGVETVSGYCQHLVRRNAPIPSEQTRTFSTGMDDQTSVAVRICQGESRVMAENQPLGVIELTGLRAAARGKLKIEVTFQIDASGILDVRARDLDTGRQQLVRINLLGGVNDGEIEAMRARQQSAFG
jgi:molecular chaperone DnaK